MAARFAARILSLLTAIALLAACVADDQALGPPSSPEEDLSRKSKAFQRTVLEATALGAVAGAGGRKVASSGNSVGIFIGIGVGFTSGTYVGFLQQEFATNEERLEQLRADIAETNTEADAAVQVMRTVLDRERARLAALRAGTASAGRSSREASLGDMQRLIAGAQKRRAEFETTRTLQLVEGQRTGVDPQIDVLSNRIRTMQQIAQSLAELS